jgi:hypothetical protein
VPRSFIAVLGVLSTAAELKVGTFSQSLMDEAKQRGWVVISMKNDWKRIFPSQAKQE